MSADDGDRRRRVVYLCPQIGTPDHDRCNALTAAGFDVSALEWPAPKVYRWDLPGEARYRTRIFSGNPGRGSRLAAVLALIGLLLRSRPQLGVIYGYQHPSFFLAALILRCLGAVVVSLNDSKFDDHPRSWRRDAAKWVMLLPYSSFLAASGRAGEYLGYFGKRRIELYHCAIDTERVARDSQAAFEATAFKDRYFVAIGRFEAQKNYFMLLDSFESYARTTVAPRQLVICGYGSLEPAIRARISASETLRPLVTIAGYLRSTEIPALLGGAIALLLPSIVEVFGIVAVEAMAAGVPTIVSSACGVADIVASGVGGIVVDPHSPSSLCWAMRAIAQGEAGWQAMSASARQSVQCADVANFVAHLERMMGSRTLFRAAPMGQAIGDRGRQ